MDYRIFLISVMFQDTDNLVYISSGVKIQLPTTSINLSYSLRLRVSQTPYYFVLFS